MNANAVERTRSRRVVAPLVDILESHDDIVVFADMPGVDAGNVEILLEKDVLTLEGRVSPRENKGSELLHAEFGEADYHRVFTLSTPIDRDRISAEMKEGVLKLVLPKAEPARAKKIKVIGN